MGNKDVVVSVGVGSGQLEFIQSLKKKGYSVLAFGKGKNSSEAIALCDFVAEIDTRDFDSIVAWINSLPIKVIAVGSFAGGAAVTTTQKLANYYRTPTEVPDSLIVGSNKMQQQQLYEFYGLSSIKTWMAERLTTKDLDEVPGVERFVIKPAIGRGSEGISIVNKSKLISMILSSALKAGDLIQVLRAGKEYRSLLIVQNGEIKLLAPILRVSYRDTAFLGTLKYSDEDLDKLTGFFEKFVKAAHLNNTIVKADVIVSDRSIDIIEMDIGVGGGKYYKKYISRLYGCSLMDEYIKLITNQNVEP